MAQQDDTPCGIRGTKAAPRYVPPQVTVFSADGLRSGDRKIMTGTSDGQLKSVSESQDEKDYRDDSYR